MVAFRECMQHTEGLHISYVVLWYVRPGAMQVCWVMLDHNHCQMVGPKDVDILLKATWEHVNSPCPNFDAGNVPFFSTDGLISCAPSAFAKKATPTAINVRSSHADSLGGEAGALVHALGGLRTQSVAAITHLPGNVLPSNPSQQAAPSYSGHAKQRPQASILA